MRIGRNNLIRSLSNLATRADNSNLQLETLKEGIQTSYRIVERPNTSMEKAYSEWLPARDLWMFIQGAINALKGNFNKK